jgi:hypothetical protein
MENRALFASIPSAKVSTAMVVKPGFFASTRNPYLTSCQKVIIGHPRVNTRERSDAQLYAALPSVRDAFGDCDWFPLGFRDSCIHLPNYPGPSFAERNAFHSHRNATIGSTFAARRAGI